MEMEEQEGKTWNVCGRRYKRTEEFWGRTSKTGIQKITLSPISDDFLLHTPWWLILSAGSFSYSPILLYMGSFSYTITVPCCFTWGVSLTVPCCFTWGVSLAVPCCFTWGISLSLTHPVLVYAGSTCCAPACWVIWGVSLTCPVLVYMGSFSYIQ